MFEKEMRQKWGDYRYQEDVVIRKKFKNDAKGFERAMKKYIIIFLSLFIIYPNLSSKVIAREITNIDNKDNGIKSVKQN